MNVREIEIVYGNNVTKVDGRRAAGPDELAGGFSEFIGAGGVLRGFAG